MPRHNVFCSIRQPSQRCETLEHFSKVIYQWKTAILFEVFAGRADRSGQDRTGFDDLLAARGSVELPQPPFTLPPLRSRGDATAS